MGGTIKGITVEIGGDTTKLGTALKGVNASTKSLQSELRGVNTLLKMDPGNVTLLQQKQDLLNKSIGETKDKLNTLKETQSQVQEQFDKGEITEEQYRDFQREIVATEEKLKGLEKEAKNFGSVHSQEIAAAGEKMKTYGDKITDVGKKVSKLSGVAAGVLGLASKTAIDFETAWTGVTKTVDGTDEQLATVRQGILDLAETTASSSEDIAAISEAAGQLGIETDNIVGFTDAIVRLGDSTNLVGDEGAAQLAKFANIVGMSQDKFENLGSAIVDLGNHYATTEQDIVNMSMRLAGAGKQVGLSEGEILGLSTALSSVGVEAEMGGSAISKAMVKMQNAVEMSTSKLSGILQKTGMSLHELQLMASNDSKGFKDLAQGLNMTSKELTNIVNAGVDLENFSAVSGMSAEQFKKAWKDDAAGALSAFIKGLGDADEKGESAITMLSEMGLTEVRLRDSLLRAANAGDIFNEAMETGNRAFEENTALADESNRRYGTTAAKLSQLKETIKNIANTLGETLLPIISSVADTVKNGLKHFTNLSPTMQKIILIITSVVAAAGPLLVIIGKVVSSIGSILTLAPKITTAVQSVMGVVSKLGGFLAAHPAVAIVAAIAAVIAILVSLYKNCEPFREFVDNLWEKIKQFFKDVGEWFKDLGNKISEFWDKIKVFFTETIPNTINDFIEKIKNFFTENWKALLLLIVNPFAGAFKLLYDNCEGFRNFVNGFVEKVKTLFTEGLEKIKTFFTEKIPELINNIVTWFSELPNKIYNAIVGTVDKIRTWGDKIKEKATTAIKNLVNGVINNAKTLPSKIANAINGAITTVTTWGSNMVNRARNAMSNVVSGVTSKLKEIPSRVTSIGRDIIEGLWNGINDKVEWIKNKIVGFKDQVLSKLKSVFDIHSPSRLLKTEIGYRLAEGVGEGIIESDAPSDAMAKLRQNILSESDGINGITLKRQIENTFKNSSGTDSGLLNRLDAILTKLDKRTQVVLDTGVLVGETIDDYDAALGTKSTKLARGW